MTYAEAIKRLRNKMLLTQMEFANYLGVSFASMNRWEAGRFEPTMNIKRKLAPLFKEYSQIQLTTKKLKKLEENYPKFRLISSF